MLPVEPYLCSFVGLMAPLRNRTNFRNRHKQHIIRARTALRDRFAAKLVLFPASADAKSPPIQDHY